jgi:hypothetical protein
VNSAMVSTFKIAMAAVIVLASSQVLAQVCPPQYQENFVQPMFENATTALEQEISGIDASFSSELEAYSQRMNSAIAVLTKQKALAANQVSDANRASAEATASALNALSQADRVKEARFEFGGEFGQGYQPCAVYAGRNLLANRNAEMAEERQVRTLSETLAAPGRYADPLQAQQTLAQEHRQYFCTQDEVTSGMCTNIGTMPGASVTVSTLFEPIMEADNLYRAKVAFVNNVMGPPDAPIPQGAAASPAAAAYSLAKAQKDALVSPALASLKEVQLEYTGVDAAHGGSDIPTAVRVEREVSRYLGNTSEYEQWTKTMAGQNTRGLLVELLKMKALDLELLEQQYRQYERMEANLATLVAGELRNQSQRTTASAEQAAGQQVRSQIQ